MRNWRIGLGGLLLLAPLAQAADGPATFDAQVRLRMESRDNRDFNRAADDQRTHFMSRLRLGTTYQAGDGWSFRALLQDSRSWDPVTKVPANEAQVEVQELYAQYKSPQLGVTFGRLPLLYGKERLIGTFEWSNVGRRFDGFKVSWNHGPGQLDFFLTELGGSPATFAQNGEFAGFYGTWPKLAGGQTEGYLLWNHDQSAALKNFLTIGGRREAKFGRYRYEVEAAGQVGDVHAYAATVELGRQLGPVGLTAGYALASGDSTPGVGSTKTFQNLFPTNHRHYGMMDYQGWRNIHNVYGKANWQAGKLFNLEGQFHAFWLANSRDFWYGAGGAPNATTGAAAYRDPTGAAGSEVGQEIDLVVTANPLPWLQLQGGYGHFFSGGFINAVNATNGLTASDSDFIYFSLQGKY
ncbi:MAG: alginate export family protein [Fimbriimonadaceae bacterium]|nr:alginate export family protein [Fimbriimonadaceae bacterium]